MNIIFKQVLKKFLTNFGDMGKLKDTFTENL